MQNINFNEITIDSLSLPVLTEKNIEVDLLRLDKIHPFVSGNKWFKLRYYLEEAKAESKKIIVTYGGAWSNHIIATAAICKINNLHSLGIIRGEETSTLSPSLLKAKEFGMNLIFLNREDYRQKKIPDSINKSECYFIPEGGYGVKGATGAATILDHCNKTIYTHICCAAGTGTMTAGLINGALPSSEIISISVLKNNFELEENIKSLLTEQKSFRVIHDYHFGGYAKYKSSLIDFINTFYRQTTVPTDFVYTGKLFYAVNDLIFNNFFPAKSKIMVIHSGGLQGNKSLNNGTLIF